MLAVVAVTIRNVASAAGVSPATVSHALSGRRSVSPQTVERILRVVAELGYRPNQLALSMSTGRTMTIGAVVPDIANPYFGQMIGALERKASSLGYTVIVGSSELDATIEARHVRTMVDRQVDAVVYFGGTIAHNQSLTEAIADDRPVIAVDEIFDWLPDDVATIGVENRVGGALAAQHLVSLGHRELAVLTGATGLPTATARRDGFSVAARRLGVEPTCIPADAYTVEAGRQVGGTLLSRHPDVTGVFCANDLLALGLMQIARETGRNVPGDLSVVGFDDIFVSRMVSPALTTVRQPLERIGELAAELACGLAVEEPPRELHPLLPVELVVRGSTAPLHKPI